MKTVQMGPISTFKQRATHLALGLGLAATLAFGAVMPASADDGTGSLTLTAGGITVGIADVTFTGVALTGAAVNTSGAPAITIVDATGSSDGYDIYMTMSDFASSGFASFDADPRVTAAAFSVADNDTVYTTAIDLDAADEVVIATAAANQDSNGTNTLTPTIGITIPSNAQAGVVYTSTLTVSNVATP